MERGKPEPDRELEGERVGGEQRLGERDRESWRERYSEKGRKMKLKRSAGERSWGRKPEIKSHWKRHLAQLDHECNRFYVASVNSSAVNVPRNRTVRYENVGEQLLDYL